MWPNGSVEIVDEQVRRRSELDFGAIREVGEGEVRTLVLQNKRARRIGANRPAVVDGIGKD